jgi:hypothetical protein
MAEHEMLQTKAKTKAGAKTNANAGGSSLRSE